MASWLRRDERFVRLIVHHARSTSSSGYRCGTHAYACARVCKQGAARHGTPQLRRFASCSSLRYSRSTAHENRSANTPFTFRPANAPAPTAHSTETQSNSNSHQIPMHNGYSSSRKLMQCIAALSTTCAEIQRTLDDYSAEFGSLAEFRVQLQKETSLPLLMSNIEGLETDLHKTRQELMDIHESLCDRNLPSDVVATTVAVIFKLVDVCEFTELLACTQPSHRIMEASEQITAHRVLTHKQVKYFSNDVQGSVLLAFGIIQHDFDERINAQTKHRLLMSCAKTLCAPELIELHVQQSSGLIPSLNSSQLADLAWACATCGLQSPVTFRAISEVSSSFKNDGDAICRATWGFAVLNMQSQVRALLKHAAKVLPEMIEKDEISPRLIADFLWGCVRLNAPSFKIDGLERVFTLVSSRLDTISPEQEHYFDKLYIVASLAALKVPITADLDVPAHKLLKTLGVAPLRGASLSLLFDPVLVRHSIMGGDMVFSKEKRISMEVSKELTSSHDRDLNFRYTRATERRERGYTEVELKYKVHKKDLKDVKENEAFQAGQVEAAQNFEIDTRLQALILMGQNLKWSGVRGPISFAIFEEIRSKVADIETHLRLPLHKRTSFLNTSDDDHDHADDDDGGGDGGDDDHDDAEYGGDDRDGRYGGGDDDDGDYGRDDDDGGGGGDDKKMLQTRKKHDLFDLLIRQAQLYKNLSPRQKDELVVGLKKILPFTLGDQTDIVAEFNLLLDMLNLKKAQKTRHLGSIGTSLKGFLSDRSNLRFKGIQLSLIEQRTLDWEHLSLRRIRAICITLQMSAEGSRKELVANLVAMGVRAKDHVIASDVGSFNLERKPSVQFSLFKIHQLVEFCKQQNLPHDGTKPILVARLKATRLPPSDFLKTLKHADANEWERCPVRVLQAVCDLHSIDRAGSKQVIIERILQQQSL